MRLISVPFSKRMYPNFLHHFYDFEVVLIHDAVLGIMTKNHRITSDYSSFIRGHLSHDHFQKRRLSTPVRPHNSNAFTLLKNVVEVFNQQLVWKAFTNLVSSKFTAQALRIQFKSNFSVVYAFLRSLFNILEPVYLVLCFSRPRAWRPCASNPALS